MSEIISSQISAVRYKHTLVAVCTGAAIGLCVLLIWTTVSMAIDWNVANGLARSTRAVLLLLELVALGAIVFYRVVRPITRSPDDETVALMIEREWPDFKTRLIAAIQFSRPPEGVTLYGSPALIKATIQQAEKMAEETQVTDVVATRSLNRSLLAAGIVTVVATFLFLMTQPASGALLQRAFLIDAPLPTRTHLKSVTGDMHVALGDSLKITALVTGYKPQNGTIDINYASGHSQELVMERDANTDGMYFVTLDAVQESFTYTVNVYDAHSENFTITALERPAVAHIEISQIYPAYTGMGTVIRQPDDLTLLAGSRLHIHITATKPLRSTALADKSNEIVQFVDEKVGHGGHVSLAPSGQNAREADAEMDLPNGLYALSVRLLDQDDLESKDSTVYQLSIVPDHAPSVRINYPLRKEELVTAQAQLEVGFLAEDDYLLGKLTFRYKVDDGSVESIPLDVGKRQKLAGHYLWDISKIAVPPGKPTLEGSVVEYWLEVEDTNNLSGPGKGESEHYAARVVTRAEKLEEMAQRSDEVMGGVKESTEGQDVLSHKLGVKLNELPRGPATAPAPQNP